jgi:hypothetical protein
MADSFVPYHQHLLVKCWVKNPPKSEEVLNKYKEIIAAKEALKRRVAFLEDQNNKLKLKGALAPLIKEAELESRGVDRALIKDKLNQ